MTPPPANACLPSLSTITCIPSRRHPILMPMSFDIYTLIVVSLPYYVAPCGSGVRLFLNAKPLQNALKKNPVPRSKTKGQTQPKTTLKTRRSHPQDRTNSSIPCPSTLPFPP